MCVPYYEKFLNYTKTAEDLYENLKNLKILYKNYKVKDKNLDSDDEDDLLW